MNKIVNIFETLPNYPCEKKEKIYDCGDGASMLLCRETDCDTFLSYCDKVEKSGFTLYDKTDFAGNVHRTYINDKILLQVYFTPSDKSVRIIADPNTTLYDKDKKQDIVKKCDTEVYQFETDHSLIDCGMCYIIRCCDNSFFVIDSAHIYSVNDDIRIYDFLRSLTPENEKIVISGWFFSHGHTDHITKFMDFLRYDMKNVVIESLYFNMIPTDHRDNANWDQSEKNSIKNFLELTESHKEIKKIKLHTGERFYVRNLCFEVLCTHEDIYPNTLADFNNSSTVIMMHAENNKVFFPGDASGESSKILTSRYGDYLECDILQAAHHGHFGCSVEFYEMANAKVVLFPTTQIKYDEEFTHYEANRKAVEISDEVYISSNGTVGFKLPYQAGTAEMFPDETFEDFNGIYNMWAYEYTDERKNELKKAFLERGGKEENIRE